MHLRLVPVLLISLALAGCGHRPTRDGLFSGQYGVINTADPAFNTYYRLHQDNDTGYRAPRGYIPPPQPPRQPDIMNSPAMQQYYNNPTDADSSYVAPRPAQPDPLNSPAMQQYYEHPTDNDSSYVPPKPTTKKPPEQQRYPDHDEDYYPSIYDY